MKGSVCNDPKVDSSGVEVVAAVYRHFAVSLPASERLHKALAREPQLARARPEDLIERAQRLLCLLALKPCQLLPSFVRNPYLLLQDAHKQQRTFHRLAKLLDASPSRLAHTLRHHPQILCLAFETVASNLADTRNALGLTAEDAARMALRSPALLFQKPATIAEHVEQSANALDVPAVAYLKAAQRQPQLLSVTPEYLKANVARVASALNVSSQRFSIACLKQPQLLYMSAANITRKSKANADELGLTLDEFVALSMRHPQLLYQKPETLRSNLMASASLLGIEKTEFVTACMRQPQMFSNRPTTLASKLPLLQEIARLCGTPHDPVSILRQVPGALCYGLPRLERRRAIALQHPGRFNFSKLLTASDSVLSLTAK